MHFDSIIIISIQSGSVWVSLLSTVVTLLFTIRLFQQIDANDGQHIRRVRRTRLRTQDTIHFPLVQLQRVLVKVIVMTHTNSHAAAAYRRRRYHNERSMRRKKRKNAKPLNKLSTLYWQLWQNALHFQSVDDCCVAIEVLWSKWKSNNKNGELHCRFYFTCPMSRWRRTRWACFFCMPNASTWQQTDWIGWCSLIEILWIHFQRVRV